MKGGLLLLSSRCRAGVAQSVEQLICNQQVGGSSPSTSSNVKRSSLHSASGGSRKLRIRSLLFPLPRKPTSLGFARRNELGFARRNGSAKLNMGEFPSGQRGQTVNLLAMPSVVRIHLPPPEKTVCFASGFFNEINPFGICEISLRDVK